MQKQQVLRTFKEPQDIIVLGSGYGWKIGLENTENHKEFLEKISQFETGITDDYSGIDIDEKWMETNGYLSVITTTEFEYLKSNDILEEEFLEGMLYENFSGDVLIGVYRDEDGEYMNINNPRKDFYILYDLVNEDDYDWDRTPKVEAKGTYTLRKDFQFDPEEDGE